MGAPKTAITASPIYFSTVPPCRRICSVIRLKYPVRMARISSGSRRSASGVEPIISANMMVTTRLSSGGSNRFSLPFDDGYARGDAGDPVGGDGNGRVISPFRANAVPHSIQNFARGTLTVPQFGQITRRLPHSRQNLAVGAFMV